MVEALPLFIPGITSLPLIMGPMVVGALVYASLWVAVSQKVNDNRKMGSAPLMEASRS